MSSPLPKKLFDREPPHSPEAEMSLLGSMILEPGVIAEVHEIIKGDDAFYSEAHATIYRGIIDLYNRVNTVDLVQLAEWAQKHGVSSSLGGSEYLVKLAEGCPSAINAKHYAKIISEKHNLRRMIEAAGEILHDCYNSTEESNEILDRAEGAIFQITQKVQTHDAQPLAAILDQELERIARGEGERGYRTGFHDIDDKTKGFQPGELTIIAARPSMGKSALAFAMTQYMATIGTTPVAVFSMEMGRESVARRFISAAVGMSFDDIRSRFKDRAVAQKVASAVQTLSNGTIIIDDTPNLSLMQLRARARRMVMQHGVKVIIVDYLQLMSANVNRNDGRQQEVSAISRGVKALTRELEVPVVCLSQLNRASEQREGNRPRMADLRESGSIEQDADVIMLLHREEYYHLQDPDWKEANRDKVGLAEVIIAKQRNGPTGVARLTWNADTTQFFNRAADHYSEEAKEVAAW